MDYTAIKKEAESIRNAAGLPAEWYPVFISIRDERVWFTAPGVVEFAPHVAIELGRQGESPTYGNGQLLEDAWVTFKEDVRVEADRSNWERRRIDVRSRWEARRHQRLRGHPAPPQP